MNQNRSIVSPREGQTKKGLPWFDPRLLRWFLLATTVLIVAGAGLEWAITRASRRQEFLAQSESSYKAGNWAHAADLARRRLKAVPGDVKALRVLARSSARLGRDRVANPLFARLGTEALEAEDLFLLGLGLDRAGRKEEAQRVWEKAIALEPNQTEALETLLESYTTQNHVIQAARLAEKLAHLNGFEMRGELALAPLRIRLGDPSGAAEVMKRALERPEAARWDRSQAAGYRKLFARALLATARPEEARQVLKSVLDASHDAEASWLLSRAFLQEGSVGPAETALQETEVYRSEHPLDWEPSPFAGESRCAKCHHEIVESHRKSRHASTLLRGDSLINFPYPSGPLHDQDDPRVTHAFLREKDRIQFEVRDGDRVRRAVVAYAFGSPDNYVSFVGPDEHGNPYIMRISHFQDGGESGWTRTSGHSATGEGAHDFLGKPLEREDGVFKCLYCHSTDPRAILLGSVPVSNDRAIGCERCHGPGANHLKSVEIGFSDPAIARPGSASPLARLGLCGQCHSHHQPSSEPREGPYWIRFQGTSLTFSRCFSESRGALDCITCHDPHGDARHSNVFYEGRCLSCHSDKNAAGANSVFTEKIKSARGPSPTQPPERSVRGPVCPVDPAKGCVACHMPAFRSEPLHSTFADHYIRVHPELKTLDTKK